LRPTDLKQRWRGLSISARSEQNQGQLTRVSCPFSLAGTAKCMNIARFSQYQFQQ
jgi:hypothetical protein